MKVLHVINSLGTGGAEKLLLESVPLYNKKGVHTDLLVLNGSLHPFFAEFRRKFPMNLFVLSNGSVYNPLNIFRIFRYLRKYDIVNVHLFPSLYWVAFAKMLSFSNVKLVFTEHNTHNRRRDNFILSALDRIAYSCYKKIICITAETKSNLEKHIGKTEKCIVIENGVSIDSIAAADALPKMLIHLSFNEDDILLLQVSAFRPQKDQPTLIRSMALLPEKVKLAFVGDGPLRTDCEKLVSNLKLQHRIVFLGVRTDVQHLLKSADICVLSSHWEGFGLVAVEGMAAGKPFVASNVPGLSGIVEGAGVLFEKGNESDLAEKINRLLADQKYYDEVAEKCVKRAGKYAIGKMVDNYIILYKNLLK